MIRAEFLAGAATVAGAAQVAQIQPFTRTLRFAVVCPQSGPDARIGRQLLDGVRGATDEFNRTRPSFEPVLLYTAYDDHNTPADATVQAAFATGSPDVMAVIGHISSSATLVTEPAYA
nr:ABC transporter substrate-binding protein [Candidatus Eremiobacteraeota bacterium]